MLVGVAYILMRIRACIKRLSQLFYKYAVACTRRGGLMASYFVLLLFMLHMPGGAVSSQSIPLELQERQYQRDSLDIEKHNRLSMPIRDSLKVLRDTLWIGNGDSLQSDSRSDSLNRFVDSTLLDTIATQKKAKPVEKDSILIYDPAVFARVHSVDTVLRTHRWFLDQKAWAYRESPIDSSFSNYHFYSTGHPSECTVNGKGILYSPYISDDYFARPELPVEFPQSFVPVAQYMFNDVPIVNSQGMYSRFDALSSASTNRGVLYGDLHVTQNVHPALNLGFVLRHAEDKSEYLNLGNKLNSGQLFGSYAYRRFFLNVVASMNKLRSQNHGGIKSPWWLTDTVADPPAIPVRYTSAEAVYQSTDILIDVAFDLVQRLREIPDSTNILRIYRESALSLITLHRYTTGTRSFHDLKPPEAHPPYYVSNDYTYDTVANTSYDARLGLSYQASAHAKIPLPSFKAWIGYRLSSYTMPHYNMYINPDMNTYAHSSYVGGAVDYQLPFGFLSACGSFYFIGDRLLDTRLDAGLDIYIPRWEDKLKAHLGYEFSALKPKFFSERYFSNTQIWDARGELDHQVYTGLSLVLKAPWWGGEYGVHNRVYGNYTYFNESMRPNQLKALNVLGIYAQQDFLKWGLSFRGRLLLQQSSEPTVLALPLLTSYASLGYQYEVLKRVLTLKLGIEVYYRTLYYADAFNVPVGVFHRQRIYQIGNYPMTNLVLSAKWKTVNLYAMMMHLNQDLLDRNYFAGVLYPNVERGFRFGFQWAFYN